MSSSLPTEFFLPFQNKEEFLLKSSSVYRPAKEPRAGKSQGQDSASMKKSTREWWGALINKTKGQVSWNFKHSIMVNQFRKYNRKVGKDMHGAFLKKTLEKRKDRCFKLDWGWALFYHVSICCNWWKWWARSFLSRKPGADTKLQADELNLELLQNCKIFTGSLSLTAQPAHGATVTAVSHAKAEGDWFLTIRLSGFSL